MSEHRLNIGDLVKVGPSGPVMIVWLKHGDLAHCLWQGQTTVHRGAFPARLLVRVEHVLAGSPTLH